MPSIAVPATVPFLSATISARCALIGRSLRNRSGFCAPQKTAISPATRWSQQGTLPSTGLTTHNNYWNTVLSNAYTFSPTWLGNLVLDASLLHLTQTRNSDLGFALAFPFQLHSADDFRIRNFRRQPVRHSHHAFPRPAQSGEIPVPLRPEPYCGKSRAQVRSEFHSRAGAQRSVCLYRGTDHPVSVEPRLLP